jgi:hypothetical protein
LRSSPSLVSAGIDVCFTPALPFDGEFSDIVTRYAGTARWRLSLRAPAVVSWLDGHNSVPQEQHRSGLIRSSKSKFC